MARVAINGFGRIGRLFFRQAFGNPSFDIAAINDLGDAENLAYLLKYDTVYGRYDKSVAYRTEGGNNSLIVDGKEIVMLQVKDPAALPWGSMHIDAVVESTGIFEEFAKAKAHLVAGAKRVVITAPAKDGEGVEGGKTILMGVNDGELKTTILTSNGSCTTNATSPVMQIMAETVGVAKAALSTAHAYTATQSLVDSPVRGHDFRRGRAAARNIVPSTTGAAIAITRAIPELAGKFDGIAMRVPVATGSLDDITFLAKRKTTVEEINDIFVKAAETPRWKGVFKAVSDQLVSSDIVGEPYGAVVDLSFTRVIDGDLVKVLSWYDNEYGYVSTLVMHVARAVSFME